MRELYIAFRVGDAEYALPAPSILHLEAYEGATPVPGAAPHVAGLVQMRGRLVTVVDVRARFGLPPIAHAIDRRVIVVRSNGRIVGLLVDSAREVLQLDPTDFTKPPEVVEHNAAGFVTAVATLPKRLVLLVDVPRVIGEEVRHAH